jgi:ribosomal-protein-alanine N-acetyltransferase
MQKLPHTEHVNIPAPRQEVNIKTPSLETPRLILREINPAIADEIFTKLTDEEIIAFMGLKDNDGLKTERYKWENGMTTYRMTYKRFILTDKVTGNAFGSCSLHNWYPEHRRAELGYDIKYDEMKNKGYMKEAVASVLAFGFDKMELNRIEAYIGPANEPSLRLVKGFGFTEEGRLRAHYTSGGKTEDSLCFGLLKSEFNTLHNV